jgi:streptogramin lyase
LVADQNGGTGSRGALFVVNPKTGQRTILSDLGNPAQGGLGHILYSVAVGRAGEIFVTAFFLDSTSYKSFLFRVNPRTGKRTVISDFSQGDIRGDVYYGLAVDAKGQVIANLITSEQLDTALVRVDPKTDERALITDLTNTNRYITNLTLERSGKILISTWNMNYSPAIFRVQPRTGKRKLLTTGGAPEAGMAVETSGQILINGATLEGEVILRIDPKTDQRTVISNTNDAAQGPLCRTLSGIALKSSGAIVISATKNPEGTPALFRVHPKTGRRVVLSESDNPAQGPPIRTVTSIAIVPKDSDAESYERESDGEGHD